MNYLKQIENILNENITSTSSVGGGCINDTMIINTQESSYFIKTNINASHDMFEVEARGLSDLASTNLIRIPKVIHVNENFLILEHIKTGPKTKTFSEDFGRKLANHHKIKCENWGYSQNNYIGLSPQKNTLVPYNEKKQEEDWINFYWQNRIIFQLQLAEKNGLADKALSKLISQVESKIFDILKGSEEPPAILHGDLWGGNYMVDENGEPVLIDPAVYFGHREADLAMTKIFGGFNADFYKAYHDAYPIKPGYERRENIYKLYHIMNHMNLFGSSYYSGCINLLRSYI